MWMRDPLDKEAEQSVNYLPLRLPTPVLLAMVGAAAATLATVADAQLVEGMLDSATGVFAIFCALIAVGKLARWHLTVPGRTLWFVILLIGLGFTLNAFQIVCNCYIGVTRIMVAMSLDRLLPEWVSKVDERFHTPLNAHLAYFLLTAEIREGALGKIVPKRRCV